MTKGSLFDRAPFGLTLLLVLCLLLAGCGGGDDNNSNQGGGTIQGIAWLRVDSVVITGDEGNTRQVIIKGEAFNSPDYEKHLCGGMCCLTCWYDNSYPGVDVRWENLTTGHNDLATSRYGTLTEFAHLWSAAIPVTAGLNQIEIVASDPAGNSASETLTVEPAVDLLPPTVIETHPADGETVDSNHYLISVQFSESVNPETVHAQSFSVSREDGVVLEGFIEVSWPSVHATFIPNEALAPGTGYRARLTTEIQDYSGKPLSEEYRWSFSTHAAGLQPLAIISTVPQANTIEVPLPLPAISVEFSETLDLATVTETSFLVWDESYTPVPGSLLSSEGNWAHFEPADALQPGTLYFVVITTDITDIYGNPLELEYQWDFTTAR
ncbi:Ig-like domain-containing protein [Ferrimonas balearica]|uniref:Ig-like domain-containing protein n=1 Tax=Ferrimonas balearica TaxID=44012 RepID=UPI001C98F672|nr:Ig-like domain-containing protein [Ferrimonas balearica]MBY5991139.1 Ig-like domain-containing protein [Ferrimonas balearica]